MKKAKAWKPGEAGHNLMLAVFGNRFAGDVWNILCAWEQLFELRPKPGEFNVRAMRWCGFTKSAVMRRHKELSAETAALVAGAIQSGDASWLLELAALVEGRREQRDPLREWLLILHYSFKSPAPRQVRFFTCSELCQMAASRGVVKETDSRRMNELCDELGIKRKRDTRGRHKAKRGKKSTGELRR